MDADREWWLRVPGVLLSPRSVFVAMRDDSREDMDARSEPVLALTSLAGIAAALGSSTARTLYDDSEYDAALVAVWAVVAGGFIAFAGYFIVGGALYLGARGLGSEGTFRRARHVLALRARAASRSRSSSSGRSSSRPSAPTSSAAAAPTTARRRPSSTGLRSASPPGRPCSSLVGVRAVHGWSWWRSLAALALVALFLAAFAYLPSVI